jgi:hypothetical protein
MDDRIEPLRSRLQTLTRETAPTGIRDPAAVRAQVVELARESEAAGTSLGRLAAGLGLPRRTITRWQRRPPPQTLRRVRIAPERVRAPTTHCPGSW